MKFIRFLSENNIPTLGFLNKDKVLIPNKPKNTFPYSDPIEFLYQVKKSKLNLKQFFDTLTFRKEIFFSELDKKKPPYSTC